jgi:hypothetical protein
MILLLFPSMTELAEILVLTPATIRCDDSLCLPILAYLFTVGKQLRFSSIILPIVGIHANVSFVILFSVRAPDSLEMEQIEVHIRHKLLY